MSLKPAKACRILNEFDENDMHDPILAKQLLVIARENEENSRKQIAALQLCMDAMVKKNEIQVQLSNRLSCAHGN
jgi:hypothetical protein